MEPVNAYHVVRDFVFAALLAAILIRQEKTMSQVDDLNTEVAEVVADEAKIKADIATAITLLQAGTPDISGALALLTTLHGSLQSDDSELEAAEAPPTTPAQS
jgi:hypothetical protein